MWICGIGWPVLFSKSHADFSVEGAALGIDVDRGIDRRDLGLEQVFVLLELAFVVGLNVSARLGVEIFVEDVGIVKVPGARAGGDQSEQQSGRHQPGRAPQGQPGAGTQRVFGSAARESHEMIPSTAVIASQ